MTAVYIYGPLVKRLRHRPFTAVTRVRFSYGSPGQSSQQTWLFFFLCGKRGRIELYEFVALKSYRRVRRHLGAVPCPLVTFPSSASLHPPPAAVGSVARTGHQKSSDLLSRDFFLLCRTFLHRGIIFLAGDGRPLVTYGDIPLTGGPLDVKFSRQGGENFTVTPIDETATLLTLWLVQTKSAEKGIHRNPAV